MNKRKEVNKNHPQYEEYKSKWKMILDDHRKNERDEDNDWEVREKELATIARLKQLRREYSFLWDE